MCTNVSISTCFVPFLVRVYECLTSRIPSTNSAFPGSNENTHCSEIILHLYCTISMTVSVQMALDLMTDPLLTPLCMFGFVWTQNMSLKPQDTPDSRVLHFKMACSKSALAKKNLLIIASRYERADLSRRDRMTRVHHSLWHKKETHSDAETRTSVRNTFPPIALRVKQWQIWIISSGLNERAKLSCLIISPSSFASWRGSVLTQIPTSLYLAVFA